jgi:uncharacterized protein YecE (DUF72 family)
MRIVAGTSGFAYKEWKGNFYPEDLPDKRMLEYYVSQLPTVEINNTFYRMPNANAIARWIEVLPEGFRLVLKATRRITHFARLGDVEDTLAYLLETTEPLGERLAAHLFQLPPNFARDDDRLQVLLDRVPSDRKIAVEFRHASWFDDGIYEMLRARDAAMVIADGEKVDVPLEATASWGYVRLREADYSEEDLAAWLDRIVAQPWQEALVFFKHEDAGEGPEYAHGLMRLAAAAGHDVPEPGPSPSTG